MKVYVLEPADMELLAELAPNLVAQAMGQGFPGTVVAPRSLMEAWWRTVAVTRHPSPSARTGPLPQTMADRARWGIPNWWLRRGYGILEGRWAPVFAVYAHRVHEGEGRTPPLALTALAARMLVSDEVREL